MKNLKVFAAVSAAMAMSSAAFALDPAGTVGAATKLVVAGSSAVRDTFQAEFLANCQAGTANIYQANPGSGQDFRAYSCQLLNAAPVPTALRNTTATVYYRSEGGSVWGPGSIAKSQQITRLVVNATCTVVAPPAIGQCAASGYSLVTDTGTGNLAKDTTDLGTSDEEPGQYRGENWALGLALGSEPAPGSLESLTRSVGLGQVFGVLVNTANPITNISRQDLASIYAGNYSDWSQVQDSAGNPLPAGPITVCRRENGSGTQVGAAVYFLQQNCGASSAAFVTQPTGPNGNPVIENGATGTLESCVNNNPGAIGPNVFKSPAAQANTKYISLDGIAPSKVAAAQGKYAYWFELAASKRPGLTGNPNALADFLIARTRAVAGIPGTSASAFALPGIPGNSPVLPVATTGTPVAIATKGGNTCKVPLGLN